MNTGRKSTDATPYGIEIWLAACAWQREQDAREADKVEQAEQQSQYKVVARVIAVNIRGQRDAWVAVISKHTRPHRGCVACQIWKKIREH